MAEDTPRSIWLRPERTGRGPAPDRDRATIAAAAIDLADAEGLDAVSMRRVAAALGAGPASLYRDVTGRPELVELMVDTALGPLDRARPRTGDWRRDLLALAHDLRDVYRHHPWMLDVTPGSIPPGPNAVDRLEHGLAALHDLDVATSTKMETLAVFFGMVFQLSRAELLGGDATADTVRRHADFLTAVVLAGQHPHLAAALGQPTAAPTVEGDLMDRLLPRMLSGLLGVDGT